MNDIIFERYLLIILLTMFTTANSHNSDDWPPPPKWQEKAKTARYLVHYAEWGIVSALSPEYNGVPFGTLQSFADGTIGNSSGNPYFYIASISDTYMNMRYNNHVSFTISEASGTYCQKQNWDPEEPVCSRVTLVGQMVNVTKKEVQFAKTSLFTRHPDMKDWPHSHGWNFYKLKISAVHLLDFFGGATHVKLEDYFKATP